MGPGAGPGPDAGRPAALALLLAECVGDWDGPEGEGGRAGAHQGDPGVPILQHRVQQGHPTGHAQDPGAWTLVPGSCPHFHSLAVVDFKQAT